MAPIIAAGLLIALAAGRALNALALGDDTARALGTNIALARGGATLGFVLLAGAAVAAAGPIAFVGLAVPHIARGVVGPDYRWTIPYAIVLGAALLLAERRTRPGDRAARRARRRDRDGACWARRSSSGSSAGAS